jgi:pSer/pThr/pTyr-binding forkhead associated (FHA) protein
MRLALIVQSGAWTGKELAVTRLPFFIGRGGDCHLRCNNSRISVRHAALLHHDGRLYLRDLGSTNGTAVNGQLLRDREVEVGDGALLEFGALKLLIRFLPGKTLVPPPKRSVEKSESVPGGSSDATKEDSALADDTATSHPSIPPGQAERPPEQAEKPSSQPPAGSRDSARLAGDLLQSYLRKLKKEGLE